MLVEQDRHKRLYDLHSWSGVLLGLFIYVVAFTGIIALFGDELGPWENPAQRLAIPEKPFAIDETFQNFAKATQEKGELQFVRIDFPHEKAPYYGGLAGYNNASNQRIVVERKWHPTTGELLPKRGDGLSHWLLDIHRKLMLPTTLGRTLVGIAGIVMLVLIVTGIFIHGKIIKGFFTLRLDRSTRLKWQDSHKVLGIIGLPFSIMISFTGAFLGVIAILSPLVAVIAFQGDTEALIAKVIGEPLEASGESAVMLSVDKIHAMQHPDSDKVPTRVIITNYGDKNAHYRVIYPAIKELNSSDQVELNGVDGSVIDTGVTNTKTTAANRVINAITPLHYATYGDIWLKWVYALLGLFLALLTATGLMLFVERRLHGSEGNRSEQFYQRLSKTNIGVCLGFPMATVILFYHDKLYTGLETDRLYWTGITYFAVAIATTIFSWFQQDGYKTVKRLMIALGVLTTGIPLLNLITTGATLWVSNTVGETFSNGTDIGALVLGIIIIVSSTQIPTKRNNKRKPQSANIELTTLAAE